ncbi:N-acetylmuramoyl-L-alanine amidase [Acetohalobium arabaticum]|uniref:N-acetylmuramoyl-L-alanine amidase n=1 Tax=Acetohalobium arabaticum (strain ATCC 49924 / DSM 5501 / Z-7288) TaxID=574087 RepID=D9QQJ3_ACEAZ|nr:N-acetylmuramoyl-L-alanine amidase [Acetohalobium arabaticum]ADL12784.1 N-acetylmuramoyl-L-alanine amidase [Acetohalobium arabaticum DSM 5501]
MTIKYKVLVILLAIIILFSFSVEAKEAKLIIDGQRIKTNLIIINGRTLVPAEVISKHFGAKLNWDSRRQELRIDSKNLTAKLTVGSNQAVVNSITVPLQTKVRVSNGKVLVPLRFLPKIYGGNLAWKGSTKTIYYHSNRITNISGVMASSLTSNSENYHWKKSKRIVIDPGHGGESPGAIGHSGVEEKRVNYQIASRVYQQLKEEGFQVILTREQGQDLPLLQRSAISNDWPADMFISIHADYNYRSWITGTTTYAHWNASKNNWALAWYVQDEIVKRTGTDSNGLKAANFAVLRGNNVPAILVETAFLSNPKEEYLLTTPAFQQKIVEGVVAGIKRYYYN